MKKTVSSVPILHQFFARSIDIVMQAKKFFKKIKKKKNRQQSVSQSVCLSVCLSVVPNISLPESLLVSDLELPHDHSATPANRWPQV